MAYWSQGQLAFLPASSSGIMRNVASVGPPNSCLFGRWTSVDDTGFAQDGGWDAALAVACSLHAMRGGYEPTLSDRKRRRQLIYRPVSLYAVKKSMSACATWPGAFSVGMCPAPGIRMSVVCGISEANRSSYSTFWKPSSSGSRNRATLDTGQEP